MGARLWDQSQHTHAGKLVPAAVSAMFSAAQQQWQQQIQSRFSKHVSSHDFCE
jgi:hypothetical protein